MTCRRCARSNTTASARICLMNTTSGFTRCKSMKAQTTIWIGTMHGWIQGMDYTSCTWQRRLHEPILSHRGWDYTNYQHHWKNGMHQKARHFHHGGVCFSLHQGSRRNCYHYEHGTSSSWEISTPSTLAWPCST